MRQGWGPLNGVQCQKAPRWGRNERDQYPSQWRVINLPFHQIDYYIFWKKKVKRIKKIRFSVQTCLWLGSVSWPVQFQQSSAFSFFWCQCFKLASTGRADNGILMISTCSQTTHPTAEVALPNPRRTVWTTKTTRSSEFPASPLLSFGLCFSSVLCCENCLAHTRKARQASNCSNNNSNTSTTTQGREPSQAYCSLSAIQFFSSISLVFLPAA